MRRWLPRLPVAAMFCVCSALAAADVSQQPSPSVKSPASPTLLVRPVFLRGTLGDAQVQVNLRPKADIEDSLEGDYFIFGSSQKVLLAGEIEGNDMFLEESENGTDVSGQWNGALSGDTISGNWLSADGSVTKPFTLRAVHAAEKAKRARANP
jgi:hypothetical protein